MKKRVATCLITILVALSFAIPVIAIETFIAEPVNISAEQEIAPFSEITQIVFRTYQGRLQFRVWGATSGQWLTDWTDF